MKPQEPARGITALSDNDIYKYYRVHCDCTDESHDVDVFIEVTPEPDPDTVSVTFFVNTWSPVYKSFVDRIKAVWSILTQGTYKQQHDIILNKQSALNFATAITNSIDQLTNKDKQHD